MIRGLNLNATPLRILVLYPRYQLNLTLHIALYVSVEPLMTIFSLWRATFHAPANSSYTRSCFDTLYIGHLSRTVTATKAGVKRS